MSGPRPANTRGHGDRLRAELLAAATNLMAAPRPVAVPSLRAVARAAGVTPSAVYLHFDSGQALAGAVVEELFADLRREIDHADEPDAEPAARLRATAHALAAWAERRPGAYQVLFETPDPVSPVAAPADGPSAGPGLDLLDRVSQVLTDMGHHRDQQAEPERSRTGRRRAVQIWAALHGLISLRLHKPHDFWVSPLHDDIDDLLDALVVAND